MTDAEMMEILNVPFVFWCCPKRCRGMVEWNDDRTDAECMVCGEKRSKSKSTADMSAPNQGSDQ